MSLINPDDVLAGIVTSIRTQVGNLLSQLPNGVPSVIQEAENGIRPDFPYITVSLQNSSDQSGSWVRHTYVDSQANSHIVSEQGIAVRINCYGDSAVHILSTLRALSNDEWVRLQMETDCGVTFVNYTEIVREPIFLETSFINTATITAEFTAVSDMITSAGTVEQITVDGEYSRYTGDTNPYVKSFDINSI